MGSRPVLLLRSEDTLVFTWSLSGSTLRLFVASTWSKWNRIDLTASPLDLLRSMRCLWSWPMEVDNHRGATINWLMCAALTCLNLLGPRCRSGTGAGVCICVLRGVSGSSCNLPGGQLELTKKENEAGESSVSSFPLLCVTFRNNWCPPCFSEHIHQRKLGKQSYHAV